MSEDINMDHMFHLQLPTEFFSVLSMVAYGLLAVDLLLSTPSLMEPLQDGSWEWLFGLLLASEEIQGSEEGLPGCRRFGLSLAFGIGIGVASLISMVLVGLHLRVM